MQQDEEEEGAQRFYSEGAHSSHHDIHGSEPSSDDDSEEQAQETSPLVESLTSKWKGHTEKMVVQLIHARAHVNGRLMEPWESAFDDYGQTLGATALHFAARRGLLEVCKALVQHHADLNARSQRGCTPMMVAVMFAQVDALMVLIEARASSLTRDENGFTAVDLAMLEGRTDVVRILTEHEVAEEKQRDEEAAASQDARSEEASDQWINRRMGLARASMTQADLAKLQRSLTTMGTSNTMGSIPEGP